MGWRNVRTFLHLYFPFGFSLSEKIGSNVEGYGFLSRHAQPDNRVGAVIYLLLNNLLLDLSAGIGPTILPPDVFLVVGILFRLKN